MSVLLHRTAKTKSCGVRAKCDDFPTAAVATVVVLSMSEAGYLTQDTEFEGYSAKMSEAFLSQSIGQFTVYPSIRTFEGGTTSAETSSEETTDTTLLTVLTDSTTTTDVGIYPNTLLFPTPTESRNALVKTTNTIEQTLSTQAFTASTEETTLFTTTIHSAELGSITWQQSHFLTTETQATIPVVAFVSADDGSTATTETYENLFTTQVTTAYSVRRTLEYERVQPFAATFNNFATNAQSTAAGSFNTAVAAISASESGLQISLGGGMTVAAPAAALESTWWTQQSRTI
jgi:hypothetical protein